MTPDPDPGPVRLSTALDECVAALVDTAPPLTPAQRDRLAVLLRPAPRTPGSRSSTPVASAGSASLRFSGTARAYLSTTAPQRPVQVQDGPLRCSGFGATPRETT